MNLAELIAAIQQIETLNPGKHVTRIHFNDESFKAFISQHNNAEHLMISAVSPTETQTFYLGIPYEINSLEPDFTLELSD